MSITEEPGPSNEPDSKSAMLDRVAGSTAFFKSQQRGDPDLTFNEKKSIAEEVLSRDMPLFLQRFGKFLTLEDLDYFEPSKDDYESQHYLKEIQSNLQKKRMVNVKNRRYEKLQRLISEGTYFSNCEMKKRNPQLFHQMVGRHMTDQETTALQVQEMSNPMSLSSVLISHMENEAARQRHLDQEEQFVEENDDDSTSEEEYDVPDNPEVDSEEKQQLVQEFTNSMYESFLDGKDDFDYSEVDSNSEYDNLRLCQQDAEEKYFDSEEPSENGGIDRYMDIT